MGRPVWSVVIPARNGRRALDQTLDSIAAAEVDLSTLQVIVIDDGSTDGTFEAFDGRQYPFAFEIHRESFGNQSASTNAGIERARGTYVLCSAQDIIFHPEMFRRHRAVHDRFEDEEVVVLGYLPYAEHLDVSPLMFYLVNGGYQFGYHMIHDPLRVSPNFLYAPNISVRRSTLERVGLFDPEFPYGSQDTDLGIRFVKQGVRIVYESRAVGYHNHPMDLEGYMARQVRIGGSLIRLREKHPDFENELCTWDVVLRQALTYGEAALDRDMERIRILGEALQPTQKAYQSLWIRAFNQSEPLDGFDVEQRRILLQTQALFECYERVLGHCWSRGFFEEALNRYGAERVAEITRARFLKHRSALQLRAVAERRLADYGIELPLVQAGDVAATVIVHGLDDYNAALELLDYFESDKNRAANFELILADPHERIDEAQRARLAPAASTVRGDGPDAAIRRAFGQARGPMCIVIRADAGVDLCSIRNLAETLFDRFESLQLIGGATASGVSACYGFAEDGSRLCAPVGQLDQARPVAAPLPDLCVARTDLARAAADIDGQAWNLELGRLAHERQGMVLFAPGLLVSATGSSVAA